MRNSGANGLFFPAVDLLLVVALLSFTSIPEAKAQSDTKDSGAISMSNSSEEEFYAPEGCYRLGIRIPKQLDSGLIGLQADGNFDLVLTGKEICLTTRAMVPTAQRGIRTGEFAITIHDSKRTVVTYRPRFMVTDGSGSHEDFVYSMTSNVLENSGNLDAYARNNRVPIENVIYYIMLRRNATTTTYVGTVTIGNLIYSLFKK